MDPASPEEAGESYADKQDLPGGNGCPTRKLPYIFNEMAVVETRSRLRQICGEAVPLHRI
jgi:hypothetical protein